MHGYGHGFGSMWMVGGMMIAWLLLIALFVGLLVWLLGRPGNKTVSHHDSARRILAERYARGELDTDEYNQRLAELH